MDATIKCEVTEDVNSLVTSILDCKKVLTKECFSKYGSAKSILFEAFASSKVCDFLSISEDFSSISEEIEVTSNKKHIGSFKQFELYHLHCLNEETVRVVVTFEIDGHPNQWYGNVLLA